MADLSCRDMAARPAGRGKGQAGQCSADVCAVLPPPPPTQAAAAEQSQHQQPQLANLARTDPSGNARPHPGYPGWVGYITVGYITAEYITSGYLTADM